MPPRKKVNRHPTIQPQKRGRDRRVHCDSCDKMFRKARKLSDGKLQRLLGRVPNAKLAGIVAGIMADRELIQGFWFANGLLYLQVNEFCKIQPWPK